MRAKSADPERTEPPLWRSLIAEIFGTFALVFVDAGGGAIGALGPSAAVTPVGRSLATGLLVTAMIYSLGPASGAHLNPAVTIGFALRGVFPSRRIPSYVLAQVCAATAAALLLRSLFGSALESGVTEPHRGAIAALRPGFPRNPRLHN
jgi:glycerol uptake facilitator-like aquaporin